MADQFERVMAEWLERPLAERVAEVCTGIGDGVQFKIADVVGDVARGEVDLCLPAPVALVVFQAVTTFQQLAEWGRRAKLDLTVLEDAIPKDPVNVCDGCEGEDGDYCVGEDECPTYRGARVKAIAKINAICTDAGFIRWSDVLADNRMLERELRTAKAETAKLEEAVRHASVN